MIFTTLLFLSFSELICAQPCKATPWEPVGLRSPAEERGWYLYCAASGNLVTTLSQRHPAPTQTLTSKGSDLGGRESKRGRCRRVTAAKPGATHPGGSCRARPQLGAALLPQNEGLKPLLPPPQAPSPPHTLPGEPFSCHEGSPLASGVTNPGWDEPCEGPGPESPHCGARTATGRP